MLREEQGEASPLGKGHVHREQLRGLLRPVTPAASAAPTTRLAIGAPGGSVHVQSPDEFELTVAQTMSIGFAPTYAVVHTPGPATGIQGNTTPRI